MTDIIAMQDLNLRHKRVLVRADLNAPLAADGSVGSDARIRAALPTIEWVLAAGGKLMLMSHLGRPAEGTPLNKQPDASMRPVADHLQGLSGKKIRLVENYLHGIAFSDEDFILLENLRLNPGEMANDNNLARQYAALCDIFVMDAFGTAHRAQASTEGVSRFAPIACAGPLLLAELAALEQALAKPARPIVAIVGGSKVSTKLAVLDALAEQVDHLLVGGGIANTFLAATGINVGASLHEASLLDKARALYTKALYTKANIPMPVDVVTAQGFNQPETAAIKRTADIQDDDMVLDIGPETRALFADIIQGAKTIIWNGPVGAFEQDAFSAGTAAISRSIAANSGFSIAGGGDTQAAIDKYQVADHISYISTGGGAFLEFVEGKTLPAVAVLQARARM